MSVAIDKRREKRFAIPAGFAQFGKLGADQPLYRARLRDASTRGVGITVARSYAFLDREPIQVHLLLPDDPDPVRVTGTVRHVSSNVQKGGHWIGIELDEAPRRWLASIARLADRSD